MAKSLSTSGQTVSHCAGPGTRLGHRFIYQLVHTLSSIRTLHLALCRNHRFADWLSTTLFTSIKVKQGEFSFFLQLEAGERKYVIMLPNAFKSQNLLNAASCECPLFAMRSQYILDDIVLKIETFF